MLKYILGLLALTVLSQCGADLPSLPSKPTPHKWTVYDSQNQPCVMVDVGVRFTFTYLNTSSQNDTKSFDLINDGYPAPNNVTFCNGTCGNDTQTINIRFFETWIFSLDFSKNRENSSYSLSRVALQYELIHGEFPLKNVKNNETKTATLGGLKELSTKVGRSYQCESGLYYGGFGGVAVETVMMEHLKMEAFHSSNSTDFSLASTCPQDQVSNIVPIAVGAALGALVLIVLIAYLIGRRKSARGYESV